MPHSLEIQLLCQALSFPSAIPWPTPCPVSKDQEKPLLNLALTLGVAPLLSTRLHQADPTHQYSKTIGKVCKDRLIAQQATNMKLFATLKKVLTTFQQHHIPVIVLKGAALASLTYQHLGLRSMGDVDLLVKPEDLDNADHLLRTLLFRPVTNKDKEEWYRRNHHHLAPYVSHDGATILELHHHFISPQTQLSIPLEDFWNRAHSVHIADSPCYVFCPEDFILHICHHLASSNYFISQFRGLCDIAHLITYQGPIQWDRLVERAQRYRLDKHVYYTLWACQHLLGVEISSHSMQQLHHSFRSFPFEDSLLKSQIPKMVFVTDSSKEPLLRFGFQDLCSELLSAKTRSAKIKDGFRKLKKRYVEYGQVHAQQHHHSVTSYLLIYYPLYLLKKTFLSLAGKSSSSKATSGH